MNENRFHLQEAGACRPKGWHDVLPRPDDFLGGSDGRQVRQGSGVGLRLGIQNLQDCHRYRLWCCLLALAIGTGTGNLPRPRKRCRPSMRRRRASSRSKHLSCSRTQPSGRNIPRSFSVFAKLEVEKAKTEATLRRLKMLEEREAKVSSKLQELRDPKKADDPATRQAILDVVDEAMGIKKKK